MDEAIVNFLNKGPAHPTRASHRTAAKKYAAFLLPFYVLTRIAVFKIKVKKRHLHQGNFERISQISKKITRIYTRKSIKKIFSLTIFEKNENFEI